MFRRLFPLALAFALGSVSVAAPVIGQTLGDDLGEIWLSLSMESVSQTKEVSLDETFLFYVMTSIDFGSQGQNAADGMLAWEAKVVIPAGITVNSRQVMGGPLGICADGSCDNYSLGFSACRHAENSPMVLVRYEATVTALPGPLEISLAGADPSSTGDVPGWLQCVGNPAPDLHRFASGPGTALQLSPKVASAQRSWSSLKADFD